MEFTFTYKKASNKDLFSQLEQNEHLKISKLQNYIPIYERFFSLNQNNYNNVNLNHKYSLKNIFKCETHNKYTGEIIDTQTINLSSVKPCTLNELHRKIFYKCKLFSFVRAVEMLVNNGNINSKKQNILEGKQYFSMHHRLREIVEKKLNII